MEGGKERERQNILNMIESMSDPGVSFFNGSIKSGQLCHSITRAMGGKQLTVVRLLEA